MFDLPRRFRIVCVGQILPVTIIYLLLRMLNLTFCVAKSQTTIHIHAEAKSTIMTNEDASLEKYTSHFIRNGCERVFCKR